MRFHFVAMYNQHTIELYGLAGLQDSWGYLCLELWCTLQHQASSHVLKLCGLSASYHLLNPEFISKVKQSMSCITFCLSKELQLWRPFEYYMRMVVCWDTIVRGRGTVVQRRCYLPTAIRSHYDAVLYIRFPCWNAMCHVDVMNSDFSSHPPKKVDT